MKCRYGHVVRAHLELPDYGCDRRDRSKVTVVAHVFWEAGMEKVSLYGDLDVKH